MGGKSGGPMPAPKIGRISFDGLGQPIIHDGRGDVPILYDAKLGEGMGGAPTRYASKRECRGCGAPGFKMICEYCGGPR